jgi:threonine dehydrogenase-like Zn-dependent dehydrogenase
MADNLRYVNPTQSPGVIAPGYATFAAIRFATSISRHENSKIDPLLLRLTRGRLATTLMLFPTAVLEFQRSPAGQSDKATRAGSRVLASADDVGSQAYTVTVCSVTDVDALKLAIRAVEPDGACVVNTIFFNDDDVPVPRFSMYTLGAPLVTGRVNARAVMPHALGLVAPGAFTPEVITDAVVSWAADALTAAPEKLVIRR